MVDGKRDQKQTDITFLMQNKSYSKTFHLIDKGNSEEFNYNMGRHSKTHNWTTKLTTHFQHEL